MHIIIEVMKSVLCASKHLKKYRRRDYYKKPTQYWFIGFSPKQNLVFEALDYVEPKTWSGLSARERSEIHPQYANRFIRQYLIDERSI